MIDAPLMGIPLVNTSVANGYRGPQKRRNRPTRHQWAISSYPSPWRVSHIRWARGYTRIKERPMTGSIDCGLPTAAWHRITVRRILERPAVRMERAGLTDGRLSR